MQLRARELDYPERHEAPAHVTNYSPPCVNLSLYYEGDDINAFIARFERTAGLYQMDAAEMAIKIFSLFSGKALQILHMLPAEHGSYEHMRAAMQKVFW